MKLSSKIRRRLCWCFPYVRERYIETSAVIFIPIVVGFLFFPQLQTTSAAESRPITKTTSSFFDQSINKVLVIVPLAAIINVSNLDNLDDGLEHGTDVCYLYNVKEIKEN
jgi:hypothetical protein